VLKNVDELDEARTNWANKVDNLSEGDVKTSMQGEYENAAKDINKDAINSLRALVDTYKKHFDSVKSRASSCTTSPSAGRTMAQ